MVEPTVNPKAYGGVVVASPFANLSPDLERGCIYGTSAAPPAAPVGGSPLAPEVEERIPSTPIQETLHPSSMARRLGLVRRIESVERGQERLLLG